MGYISNKLIEVTEKVISYLPVEVFGDIGDDEDLKMFDEIQNFIMNNGDMVNDSEVYIAEQFTKDYQTKNASLIKIE